MKYIYLIDTKLLCYYLFQRGSSIAGVFDKIAEVLYDFPKGDVYLGWDIGKSSYRLNIMPTYKGHRAKAAENLTPDEQNALVQFNKDYIGLSKLADLLPVTNLKVDGVECDDMCSIIAKQYENNPDYTVYLLTADMDWLHSVVGTSNVKIIDMYSLPDVISHEEVVQTYGLDTRRKFSVLKAIQGDKSDNIKFCNFLGPVKAREVFDEIFLVNSNPSNEKIISVINEYLQRKEEYRVKKKLKTSITLHQDHIDAGRTTIAEAFLANLSVADPFQDTSYMTVEQRLAFELCLNRVLPKSTDYNDIIEASIGSLGFVPQFGAKASKVFKIK